MRRRIGVTVLIACAWAWPALAAEEPDYPHGAFQEDCSRCHRNDAWKPVTVGKGFEHAPGRFPLEGAHAQADCRACHATLDFSAVSSACVSCHADVHRGELGADCAACHNPRSFIDRAKMARRHQETRFPLVGSHRAADCDDCHVPRPQGSLRYANIPVECVSCHRADYDATTDPAHAAAGFPLDCEVCHVPTRWDAARFAHEGTDFPLTGAHQSLDCSACHANGYTGTPTDCYACHRQDYEGTTDPNHVAVGFPTDCAICHTTSGFEGASFAQHDALYFPITSGRHAGKWSSCSDCHIQPSDFHVFTCLQCHAHDDPTDLAGKHSGVSGYAYDSDACYGCHPRGDS